MLKTIIVLPNGTEISSGYGSVNAIQSATVTQSVNNSKELTLGSVVAGKLNVSFISPNGNLQVSAGDEVTVYKTDDQGIRYLVGLFTLEKPTRPSANRTTITAYDRITWLDKDLTAWMAGLTGWPYSLFTLADMVCEACGLALVNDSIPNGDYQVPAFAAQGITGRKLMQWIGEIAGRFCRATPEGEIEFAWYEPSGVSITPDGDRFYYQNGLTYEEYQVIPIEKVQLRLTENDVGVVWPNESGEKNTYIVSGNYLLTASSSSTLLPIAQTLYEQLKGVTYTPCRVNLPASMNIRAGHTVQITDRNGKTFTSYVMTKTQTGQRDTLECTGSQRRDSTSVVNNQSFKALSGKLLEVQKSMEGFSVTASEIKGNAIFSTNDEYYLSTSSSDLVGGSWSDQAPQWAEDRYLWRRSKVTKGDGTVYYTPSEQGVCITSTSGTPGEPGEDGKTSYVHIKYSDDGETFTGNNGEDLGAWIGTLVDFNEEDSLVFSDYTWKKFTEDVDDEIEALDKSMQIVREDVSKLVIADDKLQTSVSKLTGIVNSTNGQLRQTREQISSVSQTAGQIQAKIETITNNGVSKVKTTTGTFNEDGLEIDSSTSSTKTQITPDGMKVFSKSGASDEPVLSATSNGVEATDLHARTYLIVGGRSRFENYGSNRTGCFWIGG